MRKYTLLCAAAAVVAPAAAFAQSTGTIEAEKEIVITGNRTVDVGGIQAPDTSKAKAALTQEVILRQNPGQSILDTINLVPGVSFQNNDAYGSSGGTLNIRGFSADRISLTVDGVPLNDSGNYAIFSNQQVDPEIIGQVNVNLGTTDVDSPTASAAGGTVNYRTIIPREHLGALVSASLGDYDFHRVFGMIETGTITSLGTRAFFSASKASNDAPFNNYGKVNKQQYNGKIYQPIGNHGDFIALAAHYNQNRNNFFGSSPLRWDTTRVIGAGAAARIVPRIVGGLAQNRYPMNNDERKYLINYPCFTDTPQAGVADTPAASTLPGGVGVDTNGDYASCGTEFDRRFNPSNTGNIRLASRFTFGAFTLTIDPSYQWVKANGGGTVTGNEGLRDINPAGGTASTAACATTPNSATNTCVSGYLGGTPFFGRDVNGDGDTLDTVTVLAPSQTATHRYGVIAGLRWDINDHHMLRAGYTLDHARHRQTGEVGLLDRSGEPLDVFPVNAGQTDATGALLEKRDRLSFAVLNQFWGEYHGEFLNDTLVVNLGLRLPFFKRDLNNYCAASSPTFVECFVKGDPRYATFATLNPTIQGPQRRVFKYNELLPNVGFTYDFAPRMSLFGNYAKGLSVPSTDNLYNAFFFPPNTAAASPAPEKTDNVDAGVRYRSPVIQAQFGAFFNRYHNRTASAFDPELNVSTFRNLGTVDKYGLDAYVSYQPTHFLNVYVFGSYLKSKIKDDLAIGACSAAQVAAGFPGCGVLNAPIYASTAGKRESGAPKYTYGATVRGTFGPFDLGVTAKRTGPRFVYDTNEPVHAFVGNPAVDTIVFPSSTPAYWLVNLDARFSLKSMGLERTYVQLNVYNLFDQFYVGGFGGSLNQSITRSNAGAITAYGTPGFVQIGAPRTVSATLVVGF